MIMGSTLEDRGFDKAVTLDGLRRISTMATDMLPALGGARLVEAWSGLRPAPVDNTLVLGEGALGGLFFATGHYRNGILLTPITGEVIRDLVLGRAPPIDIQAFKP